MAHARFRWQVVCAGAGLGGRPARRHGGWVDPRAVADDPTELIATLALLVSVTSVTSALMHGELSHRDRAVLDPLTGPPQPLGARGPRARRSTSRRG